MRFVKRFCRSRTSFNLPGGMIVSTLIAECYVSDDHRDDVSLYKTLEALKSRLWYKNRVFSPVDSSIELTSSTEHHNQVKRLKKELDKCFPKLAILNNANCTSEQAQSAWDWIFNHSFWHIVTYEEVRKSLTDSISRAASPLQARSSVQIKCALFRKGLGLAYSTYKNNGARLPKGIGLRFTVLSTNVPGPYETRWTAQNEGDEAEEAEQLTWTRTEPTCETSTAYTGQQKMTCTLVKGGLALASETFVVNIR